MALHVNVTATDTHQPWQRLYASVEDAFAASFTSADDGLSVLVTGEALGPQHYVVRDVGAGVYKPTPLVGIAATYEAGFANPAGVGIAIPSASQVVVNTTSLPGLVEILRVPRDTVVWDVNLVTGEFITMRAGRIRLALTVKHKVSANTEFYAEVQKYNAGTMTWDELDEVLAEDYRVTSGSLTRTDLVALEVLAGDVYRFGLRHRDVVSRTWTFYRLVAAANYVRLG